MANTVTKRWLAIIPILLTLVALGGTAFYLQSEKAKEKEPTAKVPKKIKISSPAFKDNSFIPPKYTCDGENINPPLEIRDTPQGAKSLVLIVHDPDAPQRDFLHWLVFNIDPKTHFIEENSLPTGAVQGKNNFGKEGYDGPCPPSGTHRYFFKIYALDTRLDLPSGSKLVKVKRVMRKHILDMARLSGLYQKK